MLMSNRWFVLVSIAGFAMLYTGPAIVVGLMRAEGPRAPDLALALMIGGFVLMMIGIAPLFTRLMFRLWAERGLISARYLEAAPRRRLADLFAILFWAVWLAGALIVVALAWDEMRAGLRLG